MENSCGRKNSKSFWRFESTCNHSSKDFSPWEKIVYILMEIADFSSIPAKCVWLQPLEDHFSSLFSSVIGRFKLIEGKRIGIDGEKRWMKVKLRGEGESGGIEANRRNTGRWKCDRESLAHCHLASWHRKNGMVPRKKVNSL